MPKFLCVKTFKKFIASTLITSLLLNPIAHATSSYIEIDSQESDTADRLHTMMPLSNVQDISHIEIDSDEQRVRVYRDTETPQSDLDPETSSQSPRESVVEVSRDDVYNLPWHLGQEGLLCFLSQHTAWLTPLSEGEYKLEFKGRLLGGMWWGDSSEDSGGYSNDYDSGSYSSDSRQCPSNFNLDSDGCARGSDGRTIPVFNITESTVVENSNSGSSDTRGIDYGRSYGKNSDGGSSSSDTSSSSDYGCTNSSSTTHHSRPATRKPAAAPKPPDLSKLFARLNIKPAAKPAAKPAPKIDLFKSLAVAKPAAKPAAPVAKPIAPSLFKSLAVAKSVAKPAAPVAKPAPKADLSKLLAVAKPVAKPPAKPAPKADLSKLLAVAKPVAKPPAKPAPSTPLFTQLESIRQAAAQKAQQQKKITEVVQVLQAMNREGLISQNLFTVPAFLSSYTPEKLEILVDQLQILKDVLREEGSQNQLMSARDIEDLFISQGEAKFVPVFWPLVKEILRPFLLPAFKQGLRVGRNTFQKVDKIFQQNNVKRFIEKDWKKDLDIPQGWNKTTADNAKGVRYRAPPKKSGDFNEIRVMKGQPKSDYPGQRVDYIKLNNNGKYYDINGTIVSEGSQEAHIPLKGNEKIIENLIKQIWK